MAIAVAPGVRGLMLAALLLPSLAGAAELRAVARPAPPLALDRLDGPPFALDEAAGTPVVVHFFATWCPPCVPEMAALGRFAAARADRPLSVVAIDVAEPDQRVRRFLEAHPSGLTVLMDRDRATARAWGVSVLPASFVLDAGHVVALAAEGEVDWDDPAVWERVDRLIENSKHGEQADEPS